MPETEPMIVITASKMLTRIQRLVLIFLQRTIAISVGTGNLGFVHIRKRGLGLFHGHNAISVDISLRECRTSGHSQA